jgi:uncharacterized protein (TIGR04141 family)
LGKEDLVNVASLSCKTGHLQLENVTKTAVRASICPTRRNTYEANFLRWKAVQPIGVALGWSFSRKDFIPFSFWLISVALMPKLNSFSLYLAKSEATDFDELITANAQDMVTRGVATKFTSDNFANSAALYVFHGQRTVPKWVALLKPSFTLPDNLFAQSPCAILAFKKDKSLFAITFAYAHVYLDDAITEADFGLKVAINAVNDERLRSVERSNIGAAIRDFAQAAGQRDLQSFGFDDALDLIRKVSGRANDNEFADMVTGSRPLRFSKRIELSDVPEAALEAVRLFKSGAYKKTRFKIIDFLSPVLDTTVQSTLDEALLAAVRGQSDEFEIALPEIVPENIASFRFEHAGFSSFYPDLSLELYREGLGDRLATLALDDLKNHTVAAYAENEDRPFQRWSVHRSLVGSLVFGGERYALNEGHWYRINKAFKDAADRKFTELCRSPDKKLRPLKKIQAAATKGKKPKITYQSEESYNAEIARETSYLLLDQKLIQIDDVPGPGIEACDLLDVDGRRFIHVKKSSRQSSVLSHFFKQGGNAAQMLRKYEPFKTKLIETVKQHYGATKAKEFEAALGKRWTVEFQIADFPRQDGAHNIPFFSKLTLREEARDIEAMEFDVSVRFIKLTRITQAVSNPKKAA